MAPARLLVAIDQDRFRRLEEELGNRLFDRSVRNGALTEAGRLLQEYASRLLSLAADAEVAVIKDLEIPVSSGNVLRGDLYVPVVDGEPAAGLPTIVTYFPYVKDDSSRFEVAAMHRFASDGYAGLLVDIAGTGVSPGEFGFLSEREVADGHDVVEWAAQQPFSNGRVGMWGYSYPGVTAAHVAATRPPHLRAAVPGSIFHDIYRDVAFPGGIQSTQDMTLLGAFIAAQSVARQRGDTDPQLAFEALVDSVAAPGGVATMAEALTHTTYDAYWQERALENKIHRIEVPTLRLLHHVGMYVAWAFLAIHVAIATLNDIEGLLSG